MQAKEPCPLPADGMEEKVPEEFDLMTESCNKGIDIRSDNACSALSQQTRSAMPVTKLPRTDTRSWPVNLFSILYLV